MAAEFERAIAAHRPTGTCSSRRGTTSRRASARRSPRREGPSGLSLRLGRAGRRPGARPRARARLAARGHDDVVLAPAARDASRTTWSASVGRPVRIPYGGKVAPICFSRASWRRIRRDARGLRARRGARARAPLAEHAMMSRRWRADAPVVATFHAYPDRSRLLEAAAPLLRSVARRIDAAVAVSRAAGRFVGAGLPGRGRDRPQRRRRRAVRAAGGAGRGASRRHAILLWVGRLDPQKGFADHGAGLRTCWRRESRTFRSWSAGDGRDRHAHRHAPRGRPSARADARARPERRAAPATSPPRTCSLLAGHGARELRHRAGRGDGRRRSGGRDGHPRLPRGGPRRGRGPAGPPRTRPPWRRRSDACSSSPDLASALAKAGRARAREFSWDVVVPRIEAIYERVAGRQGSRLRPVVDGLESRGVR